MSKVKRPKQRSEKSSGKPPVQAGGFPPSSRLTSEQVMRAIRRALEGRDFKNMDEANAFLEALSITGFKEFPEKPLSPQDQAQEIAWQAMEASSRRQALTLAKQALAIDPDCTDALVVLAKAKSHSAEELIEGLERAVAAGERSLGAQYFEENRGHFWGLIETRPYMRARCDLANLLLDNGQMDKAVVHFEAMIDLNASDNQGLRYTLLGCYLSEDNLSAARRLLRQYKENVSAFFNWGRTLEQILSGDFDGAEKALKQARASNQFVELYLTGKKKLPQSLPDSYSLGSEDEAVICMDILGKAWAGHPGALIWLLRQIRSDASKEK